MAYTWPELDDAGGRTDYNNPTHVSMGWCHLKPLQACNMYFQGRGKMKKMTGEKAIEPLTRAREINVPSCHIMTAP